MLDYQPFPQTGRLTRNLNLSLESLRQKISAGQAVVYSYVIATVRIRNGRFVQTGSAPNFQGGVVTLCTCKHFMRTFIDVNDWPKYWIAGFTGVKAGGGRNALVYLMKVGQAFQSQYDLWFSDTIPDAVKQAKVAHRDRFGDVFQPKSGPADRFDYRHYVPPVSDHVHFPEAWRSDVDYSSRAGRRAALLVGDSEYSFLWNESILFYPRKLHRGQKKETLGYLLSQLTKA